MRAGTRALLFALMGIGLAPAASAGSVAALQRATPSRPRGCAELLASLRILRPFDLRALDRGELETDLADPALVRRIREEGEAFELHGTARYGVRYASWKDLLSSRPSEILPARTRYADGRAIEGPHLQDWDATIEEWVYDPAEARWRIPGLDEGPALAAQARGAASGGARRMRVRYGGSMTPDAGQEVAAWPRNNWTRDVFAFLPGSGPGEWVRQPRSIFGELATEDRPAGSYLGHRYGHRFFELGGETYVAYEEVTRAREDGSPAATELFARRMIDPLTADARAVRLLGAFRADGTPFPSAVRGDGGVLIEGPQVFELSFEGEPWVGVGFSPGDFFGRYGMAFAFLPRAEMLRLLRGEGGRELEPDLTDDGADLRDAAAELGEAEGFRGVGRPFVFEAPDRSLRVLFHAFLPGSAGRARTVLLGRVRVARSPRGGPRLLLAP